MLSTPMFSRIRVPRPTWVSTWRSCSLVTLMLGMDLTHGGHLTHGHPLNYSGKEFEVVAYGVDKETETIDYERLR